MSSCSPSWIAISVPFVGVERNGHSASRGTRLHCIRKSEELWLACWTRETGALVQNQLDRAPCRTQSRGVILLFISGHCFRHWETRGAGHHKALVWSSSLSELPVRTRLLEQRRTMLDQGGDGNHNWTAGTLTHIESPVRHQSISSELAVLSQASLDHLACQRSVVFQKLKGFAEHN